MLTMLFSRKDETSSDPGPELGTDPAHLLKYDGDDAEELQESGLLKTVGWVSAALGAVALGLIVGREIRQRYKFNRRTPYDLYAHSGDALRGMSDLSDAEFGVGI